MKTKIFFSLCAFIIILLSPSCKHKTYSNEAAAESLPEASRSDEDCCSTIPIADVLTIQANTNVRDKDSYISKNVFLLKKNDRVNVIAKGKKEVIDGIEDYWYKVSYSASQSGYIFGHYTSLKIDGQKTVIATLVDCSTGDFYHYTFSWDFKSGESENMFDEGNNNFNNYEIGIYEEKFQDFVVNPKYKGKKFKIVYNYLVSNYYDFDENGNIDVFTGIKPSIVTMKLNESS